MKKTNLHFIEVKYSVSQDGEKESFVNTLPEGKVNAFLKKLNKSHQMRVKMFVEQYDIPGKKFRGDKVKGFEKWREKTGSETTLNQFMQEEHKVSLPELKVETSRLW